MYARNRNNNDYTVIFPGNIEIPVNAVTISAIPTLSNMFLHDGQFTEYVNKVYVENINHKSFEHCLVYVKNKNNNEVIHQLIKTLNIDTFFDVLQVADYLRLTEFVQVLSNFFKDILDNNTVEDIRKKWILINDFNESDNEIINKELSWNEL